LSLFVVKQLQQPFNTFKVKTLVHSTS